MTDNEIIKALGCCTQHEYICPEECPVYEYEGARHCDTHIMLQALDLINRQKAEIELKTMDVESLTNERDALYEMIAEQKADVEKVKTGQWVDGFCSNCKKLNPTNQLNEWTLNFEAIYLPRCPYCGAKMDGGKEE